MGNLFVFNAIQSGDQVLVDIKISFLVTLILFFALFPLYGSRKSFWDAISARKAIRIIRGCILAEYILIAINLYFYIINGPPVTDHVLLSYSNSVAGIQALAGKFDHPFILIFLLCITTINITSFSRWVVIWFCEACVLHSVHRFWNSRRYAPRNAIHLHDRYSIMFSHKYVPIYGTISFIG
jgi:hypothetical protein